jgi:hypothetical protein
MEPVVGLEPTTDGLQNRCSTTELNWPKRLKTQCFQRFHAGMLADSPPRRKPRIARPSACGFFINSRNLISEVLEVQNCPNNIVAV